MKDTWRLARDRYQTEEDLYRVPRSGISAILRHIDAYLVGIRFHFGAFLWQVRGGVPQVQRLEDIQ